ncbi:MAG: hypothetical protein ABIX01_20840 [Chitinophagaceae bacterium]
MKFNYCSSLSLLLFFVPVSDIWSQMITFPYTASKKELKLVGNIGYSIARFENSRSMMLNNEFLCIYESRLKPNRHLGIGIGLGLMSRNRDSLLTTFIQTYSSLRVPVYYRQYIKASENSFLFFDIGIVYNVILYKKLETSREGKYVTDKYRNTGSSLAVLLDGGIRIPSPAGFDFEVGINSTTDIVGFFPTKANKLLTKNTNLYLSVTYELH